MNEEEATHVGSTKEPRPHADHRRNPDPGTGKDADPCGDHKHAGDAHKNSHLHRVGQLSVVVDSRAGRLASADGWGDLSYLFRGPHNGIADQDGGSGGASLWADPRRRRI